MTSIVLDSLKDIYYYSLNNDVSTQTKHSGLITRQWQSKLLTIDSTRYKAEFTTRNKKGSSGYKIDLFDSFDGIAYELKVSPNNPHHEFYKDIFKIAYANKDGLLIKKLIFCCPFAARQKLGELASFAISQTQKLGFDVDIYTL